MRCALDGTSHGFDGVDRALIRHGAVVADLYDTWFLAWAQAVQGNEVARALEADDKAGAVPKELFNHYTIITRDDAGAYTQASCEINTMRTSEAVLTCGCMMLNRPHMQRTSLRKSAPSWAPLTTGLQT